MAGITLDVVSAKLTSGFGSEHGIDRDGAWIIATGVKLAWRERLELGTGEKPSEMNWRLSFRETNDDLIEWAKERTKGIEGHLGEDKEGLTGILQYNPAWVDRDGFGGTDASLSFDIFTPAHVLALLLRFAEQGRYPTEINVEVRGLDYGHAPDGSEKKWLNNAEQKMLPIISVSYELPLLEVPEPDYADDETKAKREPRTPVGIDLAPLLRELLKMQKWALLLLGAIAGAVVLKGWR